MDKIAPNPIIRNGGVIPIVQEMLKRKLPELINSSLEEHAPRAKQSRYKYSDMIITWIVSSMCGVRKINEVTPKRKDLCLIPELKIPSHDNIGYQMKKLVSQVQTEERKMNYQVNTNFYDDNIPLNRLLINATKLMGGLSADEEYILDVDCTFINTRCRDALSAKGIDQFGFYPMICLINQMPVFVSMRNGNSVADFRMKECVEQCLDLLAEAGIKVKYVRTDGAGYRTDYLKMLSARKTTFLTGSPVNPTYKKMFSQLDKTSWRKVTIETANAYKDCEIAEIQYSMYISDVEYRIIALRIPNTAKLLSQLSPDECQAYINTQQNMKRLSDERKLKSKNRRYQDGVWNEVNGYQYKMITTNDWTTAAEELILLYNARGTAERQFSFMKNDFGWKFPPFAKMNQNTVFMIIAALANNVFRSVLKLIDGKVDDVQISSTIKNFITNFIEVGAVLIDSQWLFSNTEIDYLEIL
jgi:hypothetical protein